VTAPFQVCLNGTIIHVNGAPQPAWPC